jgi:hypothetical protein
VVVGFGPLDRPELPLARIITTSTITPASRSSQPIFVTPPAQDDPVTPHLSTKLYAAHKDAFGQSAVGSRQPAAGTRSLAAACAFAVRQKIGQ